MKSYLTEDKDNIKIVKIEEVLSCDNDLTHEIILREDFAHFEEVTTENEFDRNDDMSVDHEVVSFSCNDCNDIFKESEELDLHIIECHKKKVHSCPRCFKRFKYEEALNSHYITCSTVECELCNKKFRTPGFLQVIANNFSKIL